MARGYNTIIIGGGFYGLRLAQFLRENLGVRSVLVIEEEKDIMTHASFNNQARVHNGYHYPRSVLTALRSRINLPVFSKEYNAAIVKDFDSYYGIATRFSTVSAVQFERFFERIGAEIERSKSMRHFFDNRFIEEVFKVKEYVFDAKILKRQLANKLDQLDVTIALGEPVLGFSKRGQKFEVRTSKDTYTSDYLINTSYASINLLNHAAALPIIPLKHELAEMCLVDIPPELEHTAITIMCGPFFSLMPFPAKKRYTLSHVRYTPHTEWHDTIGSQPEARASAPGLNKTHFPLMLADVKRYMPIGSEIAYSGESLWEIKTILPQSESDDSRPILYKANHGGLRNYICIMGGKIDNIYDVFRELKLTYEN